MLFDYKYLDWFPDRGAVYLCSPIHFCFVGPRGVGKSSLLASMYHQIKDSDICIEPSCFSTECILKNACDDMKEMIYQTQLDAIVDERIGLLGTEEVKNYQFQGKQVVYDKDYLRVHRKKEFQFYFNFMDIPGGWYLPQDKQFDQSIKLLLKSAVSYIAVDTPALMSGAATCNLLNKTEIIRDWYRPVIPKLAEQEHAVIFVLSRCEKYWNEKEGLVQELKKVYSTLINDFKKEGVRVYVTWIKTLGGLEFYNYEKTIDNSGRRTKRARFKRVGDYKPENCATPLVLGLRACLNAAADNLKTQMENNILKRVSATVGLSNEYYAIRAANCLANRLGTRLGTDSFDSYRRL